MARKFDYVKFLRKVIWQKWRPEVLAFRKQTASLAALATEETILVGTAVEFAKEVALQHFAEAWDKGVQDWEDERDRVTERNRLWDEEERKARHKDERDWKAAERDRKKGGT